MSTNKIKALAALKRAEEVLRIYSNIFREDRKKDIYLVASALADADLMAKAIDALESQPVASEPIGWGWKNEMGITEVRTDHMSKETIAKLNAFPVYDAPQPVAGQVIGELLGGLREAFVSIKAQTLSAAVIIRADDAIGKIDTVLKYQDNLRTAQQPQASAVEVPSEEWVESWLLRETNEFAGFGMDDEDFRQLAKIVRVLLTSLQGGRS